MRAYLAYAVVLLIGIAISAQPVSASTIQAIPFYNTCDSVFMEPFEYSNLFIAEFNSVSTIDTDLETLNIDFPVFSDGLDLGPVTGTVSAGAGGSATAVHGTANVLPFGPVDLAFPSIGQTVYDTHAYQRTYFFSDSG